MRKQQFPEPIVGALIFNPENKIFLMKSHKWKGKYTVPGGHVELGEKMTDSLKREVKEETGLDIYDPKLIKVQEYIYDLGFYKKRHFIFLDFACKTKSTKVTLNDEAQSYVWVTIDKALKIDIESYTKKFILAYLRK